MAITHIDYHLWRAVAQAKILPPRPDVLELGEANWYADVPVSQLAADIESHVKDPVAARALLDRLAFADTLDQTAKLFQIARVFYETFLGYRSKIAIDLHGTETALRFDLNEVLPLRSMFDVVVNVGTAEHVFDQAQFFRTAHDRCKPGGFMMHNLPLAGWFDHGFYAYNPTFVADMAAANDYTVAAWLLGSLEPPWMQQVSGLEEIHALQKDGKLPANTLQYVLFQKGAEESPFHPPFQGYYRAALPESVKEDWAKMR